MSATPKLLIPILLHRLLRLNVKDENNELTERTSQGRLLSPSPFATIQLGCPDLQAEVSGSDTGPHRTRQAVAIEIKMGHCRS